MYAKLFTQIFDSSIADNWKHRHVFEDLLKLSDQTGIVDMTLTAIAARTRLPLEMVIDGVAALCEPDPASRTKELEGRRLIPIDPVRGWGWRIVNYGKYRSIKTEFDRREYMRGYMRKKRAVKQIVKPMLDSKLTPANQTLTPPSASAFTSESVSDPSFRVRGAGERGFPGTIDSAVLQCSLLAIPREFVMHCFDKADSRGGLDARKIEIDNFPAHVRTEWKYEQDRIGREKSNGGTTADKHDRKEHLTAPRLCTKKPIYQPSV